MAAIGAEFAFDLRQLVKGDQGLGLDVLPDEDGITVTGIVTDGPAAKAGRWRVDDKIVLVNGERVVGRTHDEMLALLRNAPGTVTLGVLSRSFTDNGEFRGPTSTVTTEYVCVNVELQRGEAGLGLDVLAAADGVLITGIVPDTPAGRAGSIRTNDYIIIINGQPVVGKSQDDVVAMLRASDTVALTILAKNYLHPRHRNDPEARSAVAAAAAAAAAATVTVTVTVTDPAAAAAAAAEPAAPEPEQASSCTIS